MERITALLLSLTLFGSVQFLAALGLPLVLLAPAPLAVLCIRQGETAMFGAAAIGTIMIGILMGAPAAGAFVVSCAIPALLIARGLAFAWAPHKVVGLIATVVAVATMVVLEASFGLRTWVAKLVGEAVQAYRDAGAPPDLIRTLEGQSGPYTDFLYHAAPLAFICTGIALGLGSLMAARAFFTRKPHPAVTLTPLYHWKLPDQAIWVLIASSLLILVPNTAARVLGGNILGIIVLAYACQGWAVVAHMFKTRETHPAVQIGFYLLLLLWPISLLMMILLVGIGIFDMWGDPRRLRTDDGGETPADGTPTEDSAQADEHEADADAPDESAPESDNNKPPDGSDSPTGEDAQSSPQRPDTP